MGEGRMEGERKASEREEASAREEAREEASKVQVSITERFWFVYKPKGPACFITSPPPPFPPRDFERIFFPKIL
jgi:hypothetical protein